MLDELFIFPVIRGDSENEQKKKNLGIGEDSDYDTIQGTAEYPYHHFVGIEDAWLPTAESIERARNGEFDACVVKFLNIGPMLCPWTRAKFKKELKKFVSKLKKRQEEDMPIIHISPEKLQEILKLPPSSPEINNQTGPEDD